MNLFHKRPIFIIGKIAIQMAGGLIFTLGITAADHVLKEVRSGQSIYSQINVVIISLIALCFGFIIFINKNRMIEHGIIDHFRITKYKRGISYGLAGTIMGAFVLLLWVITLFL